MLSHYAVLHRAGHGGAAGAHAPGTDRGAQAVRGSRAPYAAGYGPDARTYPGSGSRTLAGPEARSVSGGPERRGRRAAIRTTTVTYGHRAGRGAEAIGTTGGPDDRDRTTRLELPPVLRPAQGSDAVGVPARFGFRLLGGLPRSGCVYADPDWWWWIVPAGSDDGVTWPLPAHYAPGARVPGIRPRLVHRPDDHSPYTPPIPLYLLACQLTGTAPGWAGAGGPG